MNPRAPFVAELGPWALRSIACAAPSAVVVATYGRNQITDWLAMASGTATFAALLAYLSVRAAANYRLALRAFVRAIHLKAAIAGASIVLMLLGKLVPLPAWHRVLFLPVAVDLFTGVLVGMNIEPGQGVFGVYLSTLLVTLLQGVMIALECGLLTLLQLWFFPPVEGDPLRPRWWRRLRR